MFLLKNALRDLWNLLTRVDDIRALWRLLWNRGKYPRERRIFAGLELFCLIASKVTALVFLTITVLKLFCHCNIPIGMDCTVSILLAAGVGYATNYLAIEMLFKPYNENKFHPFSLITAGYWRQGLVPKNKNAIGRELGAQIENKLLNPQKLADDLCNMVTTLIQDKNVIANLRNAVQNLLRKHSRNITDFIAPQIEQSLADAMNKILSQDNLRDFWSVTIEPQLTKEETRNLVAAQIVESIQHHSPELTEMLKLELRKYCYNFLNKHLPLGLGAETLSDGLVGFIDWKNIENRLCDNLGSEQTITMLRNEIERLTGKIGAYIKSPEGSAKLTAFMESIKSKLREKIHNYLQTELPEIAGSIIDSPALWNFVENDLLPSAKPEIERLIREQGKDQIINKLNLGERVADSVAKQDVREFHDMISSIAAQHLGAIQVLGWCLGLVVGIFQVLPKLIH